MQKTQINYMQGGQKKKLSSNLKKKPILNGIKS